MRTEGVLFTCINIMLFHEYACIHCTFVPEMGDQVKKDFSIDTKFSTSKHFAMNIRLYKKTTDAIEKLKF